MKTKKLLPFIITAIFSSQALADNLPPTPGSTNPVVPSANVNPQPDSSSAGIIMADKEWKLKFKDENNASKLMEFVTNDENVYKWSELITFQKFKLNFPKEVTPINFAEKEVENIKAQGFTYQYKVHSESPEEAIIEFRIDTPAKDQQDEIQRIVKTTNNEFIVIHYAVRKNDMGETERTKWLTALKNANLLIL